MVASFSVETKVVSSKASRVLLRHSVPQKWHRSGEVTTIMLEVCAYSS
jgi:hypothetical protein